MYLKRQAPVIYLSLSEKIRSTCTDVQVAYLNKDDGLDLLINKMKKLYVKDTNAAAYLVYEKSELFKRPSEMSTADYLDEFERLYYDTQRYGMTLSLAVLAYMALKRSNLFNEKQFARVMILQLTYENMKKRLNAIHDSSSLNQSDGFDIKSESIYLAEEKDGHNFYENNYNNALGRYNNRGRGNNNGGKQWKFQNEYNQQKNFNTDKYGRKTNPLNSNGNITKCSTCQSIYHLFRDCPHKTDDSTYDNHVKLSLFRDDVFNCYIDKFVEEKLTNAVLDTGCTKNVGSALWLEYYLVT